MDRELIDQYTAGGAKLRRAVEGLTRQDVLARPGPDNGRFRKSSSTSPTVTPSPSTG